MKNERLVISLDGHNTFQQVDPRLHGHGPLTVSMSNFGFTLDEHIIKATEELDGFPFNLDMNSGNPIGVGKWLTSKDTRYVFAYKKELGWTQSTIGNSKRASSSVAYLKPALNKPNLDILIQTTATRLIKSGWKDGLPQFNTVEIATGPDCMLSCYVFHVHASLNFVNLAKRCTVSARKEVILSAGAIGTPRILLSSGLGPAQHLSQLGIKPILNLPAVGANLIDHVLTCTPFSVAVTDTPDALTRNQTLAQEAFVLWNTTGQGIFSAALANQIAWLKVPKNESIWNEVSEDPSSGDTAANYEILFVVRPMSIFFVYLNNDYNC